MKAVLVTALGLLLAGGAMHAQAPVPAQPAAQAPAATDAEPINPPQSPTNVRVDVVIIDEGGAEPKRESVTLTTADRAQAFSRSNVPFGAILNVDATPFLAGLPPEKVRVRFAMEYLPPGQAEMKSASTTLAFTLVLDDGRMMVASDTTDPATDRRVRVEVTATILK